MYSTCLGLILKGYDDYENKYKEFTEQFRKISVPKDLKKEEVKEITVPVQEVIETPKVVDVTERKTKIRVWDKMMKNVIDLFKEEEDKIM